jgi:hypothetical protein
MLPCGGFSRRKIRTGGLFGAREAGRGREGTRSVDGGLGGELHHSPLTHLSLPQREEGHLEVVGEEITQTLTSVTLEASQEQSACRVLGRDRAIHRHHLPRGAVIDILPVLYRVVSLSLGVDRELGIATRRKEIFQACTLAERAPVMTLQVSPGAKPSGVVFPMSAC